MEVWYCPVDGCDRPSARHGFDGMCSLHIKRVQRGTPLLAPPAEKISAEEQVIVTAGRLVEAGDSDAEYARLRKQLLGAAKRLADRTLKTENDRLRALLRARNQAPSSSAEQQASAAP